MLNDELRSKVARLITEANDQENAGNRTDLINRYLGEPYGDEVKGRSEFIDTSAQDAVEAILPEVMDIFTGAPQIVEFAPVGPEDEDAARQETEAVSHLFWQKNDGFLTLYTWFKEAMIQQNAYVWRGWIEKEQTEIDEYEDLTFEEYQMVLADIEGDYEIQEQSGLQVVEDPETGEEMVVPELDEDGKESIDIRIRCVKASKQYLIEPFPQEDFFITPRWSSLFLDGVPCCGRRHRDKTASDWIAFGFSKESVEKLSESTADEEETAARHHTQDLDETDSVEDYLEVFETYVRLDRDGDGVAELLKVWCSQDGTTILEWKGGKEAVEEVSYVPISVLTPYVMPHRHVGQSVVEKVDDIARVKTVLMRTTLDAIYATIYKRPHYDENEAGDSLAEDLANPAHGAAVRTGGAEVLYPQTGAESVPQATLPLFEKFDSLQEIRTGATRYNQGLDADSLNKTAYGMKRILGASQKKALLIARTFAETGMRDLFLGIHADLRKGPAREMMMRLRGGWVQINPRTWRHRTDMVVNVGMGKGDREEKRAALGMVAATQEKLINAGSRMVDETRLFNTAEDTLRTYGFDSAERYYHDPSRLPPPPPPEPAPPDPIMISAQAQAQKYQADTQRDAAKLQAEERERERKHQERMAELRLKELELTNRIQNERETLDLKEREAVMKDDLERDKLAGGGEPAIPYGKVTGNNP